jgi:phosphoribosylformylglycinamidine cyclo-ligase
MSDSQPWSAGAYKRAGVDIAAGEETARRYGPHAARTWRPEVLTALGGFGGGFALPVDRYPQPVLVSGADGVGTKLKLAFALNRHDTVGIDCVAMCVNDILTLGAEPLFFLDYFATGRLDPDVAEQVVRGVADGCTQAGCALIGGETAEMPDMYADGEYDLAGFAVGIVNRDRLIDGSAIQAGDAVIGLASSGLHANGFSLVRQLIADAGLSLAEPFPLERQGFEPQRTQRVAERRSHPLRPSAVKHYLSTEEFSMPPGGTIEDEISRVPCPGPSGPGSEFPEASDPATSETLGKLLLTPTRIYVQAALALLREFPVHGMAHITGGGLTGNVPRILGERWDVEIRLGSWPVPPIFALLAQLGNLSDDDLFQTFNMGIGFVLVVPAAVAETVIARATTLGEQAVRIGTVRPGAGQVRRIEAWR